MRELLGFCEIEAAVVEGREIRGFCERGERVRVERVDVDGVWLGREVLGEWEHFADAVAAQQHVFNPVEIVETAGA